MEIRKIKKTDNKSTANLIKKVFEEHNAPKEGTVYSDSTTNNLYELFKKEKSVFWVIAEQNDILGCCGVYPTEGLPDCCVELVKFYLSPEARGKGLGKKLMQQNIESARKLGYSELYLESLPEFSNAVTMYKKIGFKKLEKPLGTSGHFSCDIWMIKNLSTKEK